MQNTGGKSGESSPDLPLKRRHHKSVISRWPPSRFRPRIPAGAWPRERAAGLEGQCCPLQVCPWLPPRLPHSAAHVAPPRHRDRFCPPRLQLSRLRCALCNGAAGFHPRTPGVWASWLRFAGHGLSGVTPSPPESYRTRGKSRK